MLQNLGSGFDNMFHIFVLLLFDKSYKCLCHINIIIIFHQCSHILNKYYDIINKFLMDLGINYINNKIYHFCTRFYKKRGKFNITNYRGSKINYLHSMDFHQYIHLYKYYDKANKNRFLFNHINLSMDIHIFQIFLII